MTTSTIQQTGQLAKKYCKLDLSLEVLKSNAGFYIGTSDNGLPVSRESVEYFKTQQLAENALVTDSWTQKIEP